MAFWGRCSGPGCLRVPAVEDGPLAVSGANVTISSAGALVLLGLLAFMYMKLKRHRQAYALLQQKVQANLELSEMTRVGDLDTGPDEAEVLRCATERCCTQPSFHWRVVRLRSAS